MPPWPAPGTVFPEFETRVARPFEAFVKRNLRTAPVARRLLLPWNWVRDTAAIEMLATLFERYLTDLKLVDLTATAGRPTFLFCASDNSFGENWVMAADRMGNTQAGWVATPDGWLVARAIAASSGFPPVFDPMPIAIDPSELSGGEYPLGERRDKLINGLRVSDGGLYDNLALEPVWQSHSVVISIDGLSWARLDG